eukprot:13600564-Alexandrium_andersonii.AAC.1
MERKRRANTGGFAALVNTSLGLLPPAILMLRTILAAAISCEKSRLASTWRSLPAPRREAMALPAD